MNDSVPVVAKPPARDHAPPDRGQEPAPSDAFAAALGAAQPAEAPPPADPTARTAHAEGTKAEGDSSGPHTRKTARVPSRSGAVASPAAALAAAAAHLSRLRPRPARGRTGDRRRAGRGTGARRRRRRAAPVAAPARRRSAAR